MDQQIDGKRVLARMVHQKSHGSKSFVLEKLEWEQRNVLWLRLVPDQVSMKGGNTCSTGLADACLVTLNGTIKNLKQLGMVK